MSDRFIPVPFRTETLYVLDHDGQPYVPLRPIVEGMGLQCSAQLAKLKGVSISTHLRARYHHMVIPLPTPGGLQETICLPLRKLNGWLFSINP
ncbi:MAG: phage antirepressor N-terminal domain-containing protein [Dehalococcoidia bacterium]